MYASGVRISVDADRCEGHGRCYDLAAELFQPDDEGHALLVGDGAVAPEHEAQAVLAVRNCPEQALALDS